MRKFATTRDRGRCAISVSRMRPRQRIFIPCPSVTLFSRAAIKLVRRPFFDVSDIYVGLSLILTGGEKEMPYALSLYFESTQASKFVLISVKK